VSWLRARVLVSGRVQGVWFRESTRRRAEELGVGGWIRNLPDGRVEALFEGEESRVRSAIEFVKVGPPLARVRDVVVMEEGSEEAPPASGPPRFRIG
jgi:acylphosphatase